MASLLAIYVWGKTNFEKTSPKEFIDAFYADLSVKKWI